MSSAGSLLSMGIPRTETGLLVDRIGKCETDNGVAGSSLTVDVKL